MNSIIFHVKRIIGKITGRWYPINIYPSANIGDGVNIGMFSEIGDNVLIGDRTRIGKGCFICEGVEIGKDCFIAPHVAFTNDKYPPSGKANWEKTIIEDGVSIGAASTILCGITIGEGALIGAGSVVTKDVPPKEVWCGVPAKKIRGIK